MLPANPPTPKKRNLPFQFAGNLAGKPAEPLGTPLPMVVTDPRTSQNSGFKPDGATSVADVTVMLGTLRARSATTVQFGIAAEAGVAARMPPSTTVTVTIERRPFSPCRGASDVFSRNFRYGFISPSSCC